MMSRNAIFWIAAVVPSFAAAQGGDNYRCTSGDLVRRVEIVSETGVAVPCQVHYYKDTEAPGEPEVPWRADNEAGFCESRAQELVAQLRGWGWTCIAAAAPADDDIDAPVADDTDALSAGEP